jgi:hypothetical protein
MGSGTVPIHVRANRLFRGLVLFPEGPRRRCGEISTRGIDSGTILAVPEVPAPIVTQSPVISSGSASMNKRPSPSLLIDHFK